MISKEERAQKNRENGKKGGRPKGKKLPKTLEREAVLEHMRQRTMRVAHSLMDAQLTLARGQTFLYRIDKEWIATGNGKNKGYYKKLKPELVTSEPEIRNYLDGLVEDGDMDDDQDSGAAYYFLTAKEPNNSAVESMFNRTFGTPVQSTKIVGDDGKSVPIAKISIESI